MMHIERSTFQWNWANYPKVGMTVSPWHEAFVNARTWLKIK
jgi:phosphoribosylformylglycinamidine synthase